MSPLLGGLFLFVGDVLVVVERADGRTDGRVLGGFPRWILIFWIDGRWTEEVS